MFWSDQNGCAQDVREGWWGTDTASYFREGKGAEREVGGTKPTQHSTPIFQTPQPPRQMGFCGSQETGLAFGGGGVRGTQQRRLKRTEQVEQEEASTELAGSVQGDLQPPAAPQEPQGGAAAAWLPAFLREATAGRGRTRQPPSCLPSPHARPGLPGCTGRRITVHRSPLP